MWWSLQGSNLSEFLIANETTTPSSPKPRVKGSMGTVKKNCLTCQKPFDAPVREVNRGFGKFCSLSCSNSFNAKNRYIFINKPNLTCAYCGKKFYRGKSKITNSKHGVHFCCRTHKDISQRIGGIADIQPPHYKNHSVTYRTYALRSLPVKCTSCGFDGCNELLQVHHKDLNRTNNSLDNLEILCVLCHFLKHIEIKYGKDFSNKFLHDNLTVLMKNMSLPVETAK